MTTNERRGYVAPMIEISEISVEKGFANSPFADGEFGDLSWGNTKDDDLFDDFD